MANKIGIVLAEGHPIVRRFGAWPRFVVSLRQMCLTMNIGILSIVKHICRRGTIKSWWESAEQVIVGMRNEPNTGDERPASAAGFDWRGVVRK